MNDAADLLGIALAFFSWAMSIFEDFFKFLEKPLTMFEGIFICYFVYSMARSLEKSMARAFTLVAESADRIENRIRALEERSSQP